MMLQKYMSRTLIVCIALNALGKQLPVGQMRVLAVNLIAKTANFAQQRRRIGVNHAEIGFKCGNQRVHFSLVW